MGTSYSEILKTHFRKTPSGDIGKVSMDADMLKLLLAIDARLPLARVAEKAGIDRDTLRNTISKLITLKLIQPAARKAPAVGASFANGLKVNMVKAVGPFGEFMVQDAIADTGYGENDLPVNLAAEIILKLSEEITDKETRDQFKQAMTSLI